MMKTISVKEFNELNESISIINNICHEEGDFQIGDALMFNDEVKKLRDSVLEFERNTGFKLKIEMDGTI